MALRAHDKQILGRIAYDGITIRIKWLLLLLPLILLLPVAFIFLF